MAKTREVQAATIKNRSVSTSKSLKKPVASIGTQKKRTVDKVKISRSLAAEFADAIEESKKHISNVVTTGLETAAEHLRNRLESSQNLLDTEKSRIVGEIESLARPVGFEVLEWESANRERHGQTTVENRMKRLEKVLKAEEASLSRHAQQLVDIDNSILDLAKEIFGPETSESSLLGEKEPEAWNGIGMQELRTAFDGQKNRYCEMIDEAIGSSLESMRESEQTLTLRQVKAQESFYAIFRDDA